MPDVEGSVGQRRAGTGIHHRDPQLHGYSRFTLGDVGAELFVVNVIGALFLFAGEGA
jgi:hypothetical protein